MFYVYEWYNVNTEEIFYVGKGCGNRYKQVSKRNQLFKTYYENNECAVRIIQYFDLEQDAFDYEKKRIGKCKTKCFQYDYRKSRRGVLHFFLSVQYSLLG